MRRALSDERGVRLALDWGKARIGVAACDPDGLLAFPVTTLATVKQPLREVTSLVTEHDPVELVLGWPVGLDGTEGPAVQDMKVVLADLLRTTAVPICLVDERMSTAEASRRLASTGVSSRERRGIIDQAAAVGILEGALEARRRRWDGVEAD